MEVTVSRVGGGRLQGGGVARGVQGSCFALLSSKNSKPKSMAQKCTFRPYAHVNLPTQIAHMIALETVPPSMTRSRSPPHPICSPWELNEPVNIEGEIIPTINMPLANRPSNHYSIRSHQDDIPAGGAADAHMGGGGGGAFRWALGYGGSNGWWQFPNFCTTSSSRKCTAGSPFVPFPFQCRTP